MGAGASTQDVDLEVYRHLQTEYQKKEKELSSIIDVEQKDQLILTHLRKEYGEKLHLPIAEEKRMQRRLSKHGMKQGSKEFERKPSMEGMPQGGTRDLESDKVLIDSTKHFVKNRAANVAHVINPSKSERIVIGDIIVLHNKGGDSPAIEGIVIAKEFEAGPAEENHCTYQLEMKDGTILDRVTNEMIEHLVRWDTLEIGDMVRVKDKDSCLYYEAVIQDVDYTTSEVSVHYGEDDFETKIDPKRVIKIMSQRTKRIHHKWRIARTFVNAMKIFQRCGRVTTEEVRIEQEKVENENDEEEKKEEEKKEN